MKLYCCLGGGAGGAERSNKNEKMGVKLRREF